MNDITFEQAWNYGGPLMWVLAFFSVWELALMLYLLYSHRSGLVVPDAVSRICASNDPEAEGGRIADRLMSQAEWLADIAAIAPLVGLLGTVLGMYQAFGGIANDLAANARPVVLAQGVSQAIITTMFGLVVSIPCLVFHAMLRRRAAKRISGLETLGVALEKAFA
jgi:biopolymer transport protein ExbB/TolQ